MGSYSYPYPSSKKACYTEQVNKASTRAHKDRENMAETYNIAFMADTHLDYAAYEHTDSQGINLRLKDGEKALNEMFTQIINSDVKIDAVVHGGDIFHRSHPSIRALKLFQFYTRKLAERGIAFYGLAGNHDASDNRAVMPSVAVVDDPDKNIHALWTPYQKYQIADGIALHSVGHHGLSPEDAPLIKPDADMINIFTTHGAALDPKNATLMQCKDSPREQIIPPEMIVDDNFAMRLLGHYHSRYPVGGQLLNTWYAGSTVRRGFADDPGERGWLLIKVHPDGKTDVESRNISQRPQYDLQVINAEGMNASEVQELIEMNIASTNVDSSSTAFDENFAPIVRQKVINAPRALRAGIDKKHIVALTQNMLHWDLRFTLPEIATVTKMNEEGKLVEVPVDSTEGSKPTLGGSAHQGNPVEYFNDWAGSSNTLTSIPENRRLKVIDTARKHLESVQPKN